MTKDTTLKMLRSPEIKDIFVRNKVKHLYLVGSRSRNDNRVDSDIDVLYEIKEGEDFSLFDLGDIKYSFEEKINKEIDLISLNKIKRNIRSGLMKDKILVF